MTKRAPPGTSRAAPRPAARAESRAGEAGPNPPLLPAWREIVDPSLPFLLPLLLLAVGRFVFWLYLPFASEDAYITFRYARNLVAGNGLVFNPGERVMGFTSAPWTLWTSLGYALLRDTVLWTRVWTMLGDVTTLLVLGTLLRRHASPAAAWCFNFFFAAWPYVAAVGVSGMENSLMVTLIVLAAALSARRSAASGPVLGLLALWRPEGVAAAAIIGLGALWRDRLVALAILIAGALALAGYYGSPIPQSLFAKSQMYGTPGPWLGRHWWEWLSPFSFGRWPIASEANNLLPLTVLLAPALVRGVPEMWRARSSGLALAIAGALTVWLGYALLGVAYFNWYMIVPLAGIVALAAVGAPHIVRGRGLYVSAALFVVGMWTLAPNLYLGRAKAEYFGFGVIADYLLQHARPGEKVMLEPIGLIGYHAPLRVVDEVGLVSPQVARRRLQGSGWYTDIANQERPEWLVVRRNVLKTGEAWAGAGAPFRSDVERDSLLAHYRTMTGTDEEAGDLSMVVLRRIR